MPADKTVFPERFWSRVEKTDTCWIWRGYRDHRPKWNYGRITILTRRFNCAKYGFIEPGTYLAHRLAWQMEHGAIPEGMNVCHECDNPPCVRPDHLFLGTDADNVHDMMAKGRDPVGEQIHWKAKLTAAKVMEIRRRRAAGELCTELGKEFGVHYTSVAHICAGRVWKHLPLATSSDVFSPRFQLPLF